MKNHLWIFIAESYCLQAKTGAIESNKS
jgi:hypothetical protein